MADYKSTSTTNKSSETNPYKISTIILSVLLVGLAVVAFMFNKSSNDYKSKSASLNTKVNDLSTLQADLEAELADLEGEYGTKIEENEGLKVEIEEKVEEIGNLQSKIRRVKRQLKDSESNSSQMQERLAQLEELKGALENDVMSLKGENSELVAAKDELSATLVAKSGEIQDLNGQVVSLTQRNQKMQNRLFKLAPAGYRAGNFSVDIAQRNSKATAKARKAREVTVNFDIPNVPSEKQGSSEIYLVVTDINGNAVKSIASSPIKVPAANEFLNVDAVDIQKLNLKESQSLSMSFKPENKLNAGEYNLMVYSDAGYLGATGFRLR